MLKIIKAIIQAIKRRLCCRETNLDQYGNDYEKFAENVIAHAHIVAASTSMSYARLISSTIELARAMAEVAQEAAKMLDNDFWVFLHDNVEGFIDELDEFAEPTTREEYKNCKKATHKKKYTAAAVIQTVMYYKKLVRYTSGVPPNI